MMKTMLTTVNFIAKYSTEIIAITAALAAYTVAVNLATIKVKILTVAEAAWNAVVKVANILVPLARVAIDGMALAYDRLILRTTGTTTASIAFNRSLTALKTNIIAAKVACGLLVVALAAGVLALIKWVRAQDEEAKIAREINSIKKTAIKNIQEEKAELDKLVKIAENENISMERRKAAIEKLNQIVPNYNAQIEETTGKYKSNKAALDKYIDSLIKLYEIQGAKEKLQELGRQRVELQMQRDEEEIKLKDAQKARGGRGMNAMVPGATYQQPQGLPEVNYIHGKIESIDKKLQSIDKTEAQITKIWGESIYDEEKKEPTPQNTDLGGGGGGGGGGGSTSTTSGKTGSTSKAHEDKFAVEKEWKQKEEALNRISYATGQEDYEQYQKRIIEIAEEYNQKILQRKDLTEQERLDAQVGYYEAQQKAREESLKRTVEEENAAYNEQVAAINQRYIDGKMTAENHQQALRLLEMAHLKEMVAITKEGTKERLQAEKEYQDKLMADMKQRQQEQEQAEKEHQQRMKAMKSEYFGDSPQEKQIKYLSDLTDLDEVYQMEIAMAGENAAEKLRIEEAYQQAKKALRQKYNIESEEDEKNWLEKTSEEVANWINDPEKGQLLEKSLQVVSQAMGAVFQQMTSLIQAETEIQIASIEKRYDQEISRAEGNNYKVKKLEKEKEKEIAKMKNQANKKMFAMEVIQAVAQTAQAAINAYSSAAAVPVIGYILAPIAAAAAIAAGMLQVAAIKKQQQAAAAQGYAEGGFTDPGKKNEVAGVVHKGEWVASQELVNSPVARPLIDALDYAQRNNTIGSLRHEDVTRVLAPEAYRVNQGMTRQEEVYRQQVYEMATSQMVISEAAEAIRALHDRLNEPFVTVNTVTGDKGIKQAQDDYDQLIRNKTPKSRRKS